MTLKSGLTFELNTPIPPSLSPPKKKKKKKSRRNPLKFDNFYMFAEVNRRSRFLEGST